MLQSKSGRENLFNMVFQLYHVWLGCFESRRTAWKRGSALMSIFELGETKTKYFLPPGYLD
jgi:hypothetical protein